MISVPVPATVSINPTNIETGGQVPSLTGACSSCQVMEGLPNLCGFYETRLYKLHLQGSLPEEDSSSSLAEKGFEPVSLENANESKEAKSVQENVQENLCKVGLKDVQTLE